jgi:uncharacterized protein YidB (DUF937 family)
VIAFAIRQFHFGRENMSLLNSVLGAVLSKGMGGGGNSQQDLIGSVIGGLLQQSGGAGGLLDAFRKAGHAQEADSWQSTGQNLPIGGADMLKVLGGLMGSGAAQQGGAAGGLGGMLGGLLGSGGQQANAAGGLEQILAQTGMNQGQLGDLLAKALPQVLDGMTPGGQVQQNQSPDMMQSILSGVLGKLSK